MTQKADSAAARMAGLPVVRSAWSRLTALYARAKRSRPDLKLVCDALEGRAVTLCARATRAVSPAVAMLEPQMSVANELACRSLDWLESTFPWLQAPAEEIVAVAKDKMHEAQEMMSVVATGTTGCIRHTMEHAVNRVLHTGGQSSPFIKRAVTAAGAGLDRALVMSETLVDRMLPPAVEGKEEASSVEGFDSTPRRTYPERLQSVSTKLRMGSYKALETLARSPSWGEGLQSCLSSFISRLPPHLQHQALTLLLFVSQMYSLSCPSPQTNPEYTHSSPVTGVSPARKDQLTVVQWQESPTWRMRLPKTTDCGCKEMCSMTT